MKTTKGVLLESAMKNVQSETLELLHQESGLTTLHDFQIALLDGDTDGPKKWLQFIVNNKIAFNIFWPDWDNWVKKREKEIAEAETVAFPL